MLTLLETERPTDRRAKIRYPIECEVEFRISRGRAPALVGKGQTINISSEGLLFHTPQILSRGSGIEITLQWPVTLDDHIPLTLRIKGSIVRSESDRAVAQINSHEFRLGPRKLKNDIALARKTSA